MTAELLYYSEKHGCGATVRLKNNDLCIISIASNSVRITKPHYKILMSYGVTLYEEKNIYKSSRCAIALAYIYKSKLFKQDIKSPILKSFLNAAMHCHSASEVAMVINSAIENAEKLLGCSIDSLTEDNLPSWAVSDAERDDKISKYNGMTINTAIKIDAKSSADGIPKEYAYIEKRYGRAKIDWQLYKREVLEIEDGKTIEKFIIKKGDNYATIYFDISIMMKGNKLEEERQKYDEILAKNNRPLTIAFPQDEFFITHNALLGLTKEDLDKLGITKEERSEMFDPFVKEMLRYKNYETMPSILTLEMMTAQWYKLHMIMKFMEANNDKTQEEIDNSALIIKDALSA